MKHLAALAVTLCAGCNAIVDVSSQVDYAAFGDGDVDFTGDPGGGDPVVSDPFGDDQQSEQDVSGTTFVEAATQAAPTAWYRLGRDDLGAAVAHDAGPGSHPGSYVAGARPGAFGALARDADTAATTLAEANGPINIPDVGVFTPSGGAFTVSLWVNLHSTIFSDTIAGLFAVGLDGAGATDTAAFRLLVATDQKVHVRCGLFDTIVGATTLSPGHWTLVTVTRSAAGALKLYVDGVLDGEAPTSTIAVSDATAHLGGGRFPGSAHFDELMIFGRELAASEIATFVNVARAGAPQPPTCGLTNQGATTVLETQTLTNRRFSGPVTIRASGVQLRHVVIESTTHGVFIDGADDVVLEDVAIAVTPSSDQAVGVLVQASQRARLSRVRIIGAPRGVVIEDSDELVARFVSVRNAMTDVASNPTIHVDSASSGSQIEDFEIVDFGTTHAAPVSMGLENLDIFATRGLVVGNPAADSIGVRVVTTGTTAETALTDIDVVGHNYACLSVTTCGNLLVAGLRCRDTLCNGQPAGQTSRGYAIALTPLVSGAIWESVYDDLCGIPLGGTSEIDAELGPAEFQARQRMNAKFCWE